MSARFYVPGVRFKGRVQLPESAARHAGLALRMKAGDSIELFDGAGISAAGKLFFENGRACAEIASVTRSAPPKLQLTLLQALLREEKLSFVIEKAVELGASRIVIAPALRSLNALEGKKLAKRLEQWRLRAVSACEQSGNNFLPEILWEDSFIKALRSVSAQKKFFLSPGQNEKLSLAGATRAAFAVGPEGGFDEAEKEAAKEAGWVSTVIGPRVLRTETAGIVAAAIAQWEAGDLA